MWDFDEIRRALDSSDGIDGGNPKSKYWFIGLEYGDRDGNENADGNWWEWEDNYYSKIKQIMDTIGIKYEDTYLANLYPIRKKNILTNIDDTECIDLNSYYLFCDLHGRKLIKDGLAQGEKKVVICFGLDSQLHFLLQLANGCPAQYVKTCNDPRLVDIKFANHPYIDRLIVIKHVSWASLAYCDTVGKYIKDNYPFAF